VRLECVPLVSYQLGDEPGRRYAGSEMKDRWRDFRDFEPRCARAPGKRPRDGTSNKCDELARHICRPKVKERAFSET
jgi:hypothetical protein